MPKISNEALDQYKASAKQALSELEKQGITVPDDAIKMTDNSSVMKSYLNMGTSPSEWAEMVTTLYAVFVEQPAQAERAGAESESK